MKQNYAQMKELKVAAISLPTIGEAAIDMADNIDTVSSELQIVEAAREATIKKHSGGAPSISTDHENYEACIGELNVIELAERDLPELKKINKRSIDFSKNPAAVHIAILRRCGVLEK